MKNVKAIFLSDPHLLRLVEAERTKRGDSTPTKTAGRLISERLAQLELLERERELRDERREPASAAAA